MTDAKAVVIDYMHHVWNDGEVDACDRFLTPFYTIHHDPGDPWDGQKLSIEAFKDRVRTSRAPFPNQQFVIDTMIEEGIKVAVAWHWMGTFVADMPGFKATGQPVKTSGVTIYYMEGDRIAGHWQVTDRLGVFQQVR